jgi:hypothetical protein
MCAEMRGAEPREFKTYDKARAGDWMSLVGPTQCVAFFKEFHTAAPVSYRGEPFEKMSDCTFVLFDGFAEAKIFCETQVKHHPSICAEIFDHQGRAKQPLAVVIDASLAEKAELSNSNVRRRKVWAIVLFFLAVPLIVYDGSKDWGLIWPAVFGFNMLIGGFRLLYWNSARTDRAREQERRVAAHLERERSESVIPKT